MNTTSEGRGPFARLAAVRPGDEVDVRTDHGALQRYVVSARRTYLKAALPADVFAITGPARLALVTCTGYWDPSARSYASNLVVWAVPAPD